MFMETGELLDEIATELDRVDEALHKIDAANAADATNNPEHDAVVSLVPSPDAFLVPDEHGAASEITHG